MPVQTSFPSVSDSFPSFMSVFDGFDGRPNNNDNNINNNNNHHHQRLNHHSVIKSPNPPIHMTVNTSNPKRSFPTTNTTTYNHRESVSSTASESTDSSPTTTNSTFDCSSVTDTSGSSSPDSPLSVPLSYPKLNHNINSLNNNPPPSSITQTDRPNSSLSSCSSSNPSNSSNLCDPSNPMRPNSPGKRARNLKNLSLTVPARSKSRPVIATASVLEKSSSPHSDHHRLAVPPSPIKTPSRSYSRRRPANLTIQTPGPDRSFPSNVRKFVPPTPSSGEHSLRHTESSPSLTSVFSPSFPPQNGMQFPRSTTHLGARRASEDNSSSCLFRSAATGENSLSNGVLHELKEEDNDVDVDIDYDGDHLDFRESMPGNGRGYPNGPIRIYDSGVFLYLEPTKEEALDFDVVINVAKEIPNPFTNTCPGNGTVVDAWRNVIDSKRRSCAEPLTAMSDASYRSAWEYQPEGSAATTATMATETASPMSSSPENSKQSGPEYIHVGWDHNSEILEDLYPLCEFIDSRVGQGKRVLVHCQLGVSRSASMVVAYGLYKNRNLDFNSMYGIVKERSHWVGPNMSLIYQLTEFRSRLQHGELERTTPKDWLAVGPRRSSEPQPPSSSSSLSEHRRRALPIAERNGAATSTSQEDQSSRKSVHRDSRGSFSAVIESLGFPMSPTRATFPSRPLPLRASYHSLEPSDRSADLEPSPQAPRPENDGDFPVTKDITLPDAPPQLPSLFSPRTSEFMSVPLSRSIAGDLKGTVGPKSVEYGENTTDPRSPPQGNGRMIMRNIDEVL